MNNYEEIYKKCLSIGIYQEKEEFLPFIQFIGEINPNNIMEIGSKHGGSFVAWCELASNKKISLDLPGGIHGGWALNEHPYLGDVRSKRDKWFYDNYDNIYMLSGDSHESSSLDLVEQCLNGDKLDFLMIDGDHTYEGVKQDYEMYSHLVNDGGWIGFHDINNTEHHRKINVHVGKFWDQLEGNKKEFNINTHWAGIGVIQNG